MSISRERDRHLMAAYERSLEQQLLGRGSSLACRDEEMWKQVEGLLRDADAQQIHCLGLDPLKVMEESLKVETSIKATSAVGGRRVKTRGGLQGLARAFEVLEQASLNLHLGPWREEYKVVKMYSGMFTHFIKPVLSRTQIEKLFGLLGYQTCSTRREQLHLQYPRGSSTCLEEFLCLACAFFLARCECHLLLTALGKHGGEAQWELSMVRERQRGHSIQVAMDNTKRTLEVRQPLMEPFEGESDVDLYTDEQVNGGQREVAVHEDETCHTSAWVSPPVKVQSNGALSSSLTTTAQLCISTLNCQLSDVPPLSRTSESLSASTRHGRCLGEEAMFDRANGQSCSPQAESMRVGKSRAEASLCICLQAPNLYPRQCLECNTLHDITCALLQHCSLQGHRVLDIVETEESAESRSLGAGALHSSPTLTSSSAAMTSILLLDDPKSTVQTRHPISYHNCCDVTRLDPHLVCLSCSVFHSGSCSGMELCQTEHNIKKLGVCSCGRPCSRKPLTLCRYCGNEYCNDCWYRNPVICACGQTFDQSSSV
ncbi:spermatogenesis associated 2-like [Aulostomus maculatus]